jgi:hypothetical protein
MMPSDNVPRLNILRGVLLPQLEFVPKCLEGSRRYAQQLIGGLNHVLNVAGVRVLHVDEAAEGVFVLSEERVELTAVDAPVADAVFSVFVGLGFGGDEITRHDGGWKCR